MTIQRPEDRPPADWDAGTYARVSTPQREWSGPVLERLRLEGDETVLDAGCGSGEVTAALLDRLPQGRVIAVDGSAEMVAQARRRLGREEKAGRVRFLHQDLTTLELDEMVDAAFSNATFHWIPDHPALFRRLAGAICPGGDLVVQYGGRGNVAEVVAALERVLDEGEYAEWLSEYRIPWTFAGPAETAEWLLDAGFESPDCWLEDRVARPEDPRAFFEASFLAPVRELLPPERFPEFSERVLTLLDHPKTFNYVRLNVEARRAPEAAEKEIQEHD